MENKGEVFEAALLVHFVVCLMLCGVGQKLLHGYISSYSVIEAWSITCKRWNATEPAIGGVEDYQVK